ncbi:MAG TPA: extracellular solute-binding protein [Chthoniobacterales bacterium]|nr:extracellular solute-binding protein [Chthoniobacterales bacterium]
MSVNREDRFKISRRSFLQKSLLGTGALALSQLPLQRTTYAATGPVTLTYWHGWTAEWEKMVQFVVDMYHAKQDRVRINPVVVPWDQFIPKLTAAIAAGTPPDVVTLFASTPIPTLAAQQAIIALDDIPGVDLAAAQEWFDPNIFSLGQYKQKTYGLSYWAGDSCVLFNKQHFKEAGLLPNGPRTVAELDSYAEKLTQKRAGGTIDRMGFLPNTDETQFWLWGTGQRCSQLRSSNSFSPGTISSDLLST